MFNAFLIMACLTATSAWLVLRNDRHRSDGFHDLATRLVDDELPQTQCRQCGFDGCRPYAEAVALARAPLDACAPGGITAARSIARLLGSEPAWGTGAAAQAATFDAVTIVEEWCIGCTKCIQVCPVDAIVGAAAQMHTVITAACTGCGLCLPPCPVDCIEVVPANRQRHGGPVGPAVRRRGMTMPPRPLPSG